MYDQSTRKVSAARGWRAVRLAAVLALLWWILTENRGWGFGIPAIAVATVIGLALPPPQAMRWSLFGGVRLLLYFLKESILAGIEVARLALRIALPRQPAILHYPSRLPPGPARVLFCMAVSLVPGTLSADLRGERVVVHILDASLSHDLAGLEKRIAGFFAVSLERHR